ncbi:PoNe immunity protein domain-containing protein [Pseudoalteromonas galatheae]|uniref:PoNe immunity protein domain-containing protein n=1 Tax=Pseudoalteromonas galatheae TaxID=579562 RepID=UPI001F3401B1|nr:PoNe immunity protein domain-containing protein [Pseudoalteromonas galatheae]
MVRDKLQDKSYFDEAVGFYKESIAKDVEELKSGELTKVVKMRYCFGLVVHCMNLLNNTYSRGDKLDDIKPLLHDVLTFRKWQNDYANALPEQEQTERISWEEMREDYLERHLKWLSFAYCLDMGEEYYLKALWQTL